MLENLANNSIPALCNPRMLEDCTCGRCYYRAIADLNKTLMGHRGQARMGFLSPGVGGAAAGGFGVATMGIGAAIGIIGSVASGLIQGANLRARDEMASGVWLEQSVDAIEEIETAVKEQYITKDEAAKYFKQILDKFKGAIVTLATRSVVESRLKNQTRDLQNLFDQKMKALPDVPACQSGFGRWPYSKKCVPLRCGVGTQRDEQTGECIRTQSGGGTQPIYTGTGNDVDAIGTGPSNTFLWVGLIGLAGLVIYTRN